MLPDAGNFCEAVPNTSLKDREEIYLSRKNKHDLHPAKPQTSS